MTRRISLLLVLSLLFLVQVFPLKDAAPSCTTNLQDDQDVDVGLESSGIHLALHHRHGPCSPFTAPTPFADILRRDESRVRSLAAHLTAEVRGRPTSGDRADVPLTSGSSLGVGNYVAKIGLGTPPTDHVMMVDTGSSLTWLQCSPCKTFCHPQSGAVFNPNASATYGAVPCAAPECRNLRSTTLNSPACARSGLCVYEASYGDGSFSVGYLGKDTLRLGRSRTLPGFVFGCGQDNEGIFGRAAGIVGLARNNLSMLSQLAKKSGAASFSYCLPTTDGTGFLSIGAYNASRFAYTPMLSTPTDDSLYYLRLTAIRVEKRVLPVPVSALTGMPTVIDSGTVITRLPPAAYAALSEAVATVMLRKHKRARPYLILDTCFKGRAGGMSGVPKVSLVFAGGAEVRLPKRNVLIDVDDGKTACLAFANSSRIAIIGNQQQQTLHVAYDVAKSIIGFASGGCK